jgi:hypothetical protein
MVASQAGAMLLTKTVREVGLDDALSVALAPWRSPHTAHDPAKVLLDLAVTLAVGGTAWPTSRCCGPDPVCSAGSRRTRRCLARSIGLAGSARARRGEDARRHVRSAGSHRVAFGRGRRCG